MSTRPARQRVDITAYILEYRATVMSLWHNLSHYKTQEFDWDLCDEFEDICERLFFLMVLRPNGIFGITKAKQYDMIPAGIPSLIAVPSPDTSTIVIAENNHGRHAWRLEKYPKEENPTFIFVDLYDDEHGLYDPDRKFDLILTKVIKSNPAAPKNQYALLPIQTTRVFWIPEK